MYICVRFVRAKVHGFSRLQNEMVQEVDAETAHVSWVSEVQRPKECSILVSQRTLIWVKGIH
jgi:hypothetical protein